jgi:peptidoglycan hydrolase-like protein with peptidoglycan-binding domain
VETEVVNFAMALKATAGVVGMAAVCAGAAHPSGGDCLRGQGAAADDWQDAPRLQSPSSRPSDLVGMWQAILWADGYLSRASVTCSYDAATVAATRVWQSNHRVDADGIVGPATYGAAGSRLSAAPPWTVYRGDRFALPLRRRDDGVYEVWDEGRFRTLRLAEVTLAQCRR